MKARYPRSQKRHSKEKAARRRNRHLHTTKGGNSTLDDIDPSKHLSNFMRINGPEVKLEGEEEQEMFVKGITENTQYI